MLIIGEFDPAGIAGNQAEALKNAGHTAISIVRRENQDYKNSIIDPKKEYVERLAKESDVLHFNVVIKDGWDEDKVIHDDHDMPFAGVNWNDYFDDKRIVFEYHGSINLRNRFDYYFKRHSSVGDVMVSTPDLFKMSREKAFYMPNIIPIWRTYYLPLKEKEPPSDKCCVIHTPSDKKFNIKNTSDIQKAVRGIPESILVTAGGPHQQVMSIRQNCHIGFDHLQGYYGVCALEDCSVGIPTLVGIDRYNQRRLKEAVGADWLPFECTTKEKLYDDLWMLVHHQVYRLGVGMLSRAWMEKYYAPEKLVERLVLIYAGEF